MIEIKVGDVATFVDSSMYGSYTRECTVTAVNGKHVKVRYFDPFPQEWDEKWMPEEDLSMIPAEQSEFWLVKFGDGTYLSKGASTSPTLYRSLGKAKARMPRNPEYKGGAKIVKWTYKEEDCD